jgi:hypothetical protein
MAGQIIGSGSSGQITTSGQTIASCQITASGQITTACKACPESQYECQTVCRSNKTGQIRVIVQITVTDQIEVVGQITQNGHVIARDRILQGARVCSVYSTGASLDNLNMNERSVFPLRYAGTLQYPLFVPRRLEWDQPFIPLPSAGGLGW